MAQRINRNGCTRQPWFPPQLESCAPPIALSCWPLLPIRIDLTPSGHRKSTRRHTRWTAEPMVATGPELALTTDLPELGLPMAYFEAAKLFPTDPTARGTMIVAELVRLAAMAQPEDHHSARVLSEDGEHKRENLFARIEAKLAELGGYRAIYRALGEIAEDRGSDKPDAKGPGPRFLFSKRWRRMPTDDGSIVHGLIFANHSTQMQHLRLAGRIVELMITDGCKHQEAIERVRAGDIGRMPTGSTVSVERQIRKIWSIFRGVAHMEAARRLLLGDVTFGELLAASEAIRMWLLEYGKRQTGRSKPLLNEDEIFRVPAEWLPLLPRAMLVPGSPKSVLRLSIEPYTTCTDDCQQPRTNHDALMRAVRSKRRALYIMFPAARSDP